MKRSLPSTCRIRYSSSRSSHSTGAPNQARTTRPRSSGCTAASHPATPRFTRTEPRLVAPRPVDVDTGAVEVALEEPDGGEPRQRPEPRLGVRERARRLPAARCRRASTARAVATISAANTTTIDVPKSASPNLRVVQPCPFAQVLQRAEERRGEKRSRDQPAHQGGRRRAAVEERQRICRGAQEQRRVEEGEQARQGRQRHSRHARMPGQSRGTEEPSERCDENRGGEQAVEQEMRDSRSRRPRVERHQHPGEKRQRQCGVGRRAARHAGSRVVVHEQLVDPERTPQTPFEEREQRPESHGGRSEECDPASPAARDDAAVQPRPLPRSAQQPHRT